MSPTPPRRPPAAPARGVRGGGGAGSTTLPTSFLFAGAAPATLARHIVVAGAASVTLAATLLFAGCDRSEERRATTSPKGASSSAGAVPSAGSDSALPAPSADPARPSPAPGADATGRGAPESDDAGTRGSALSLGSRDDPPRASATEDDPPRDPPGMRGFYAPTGKLPKVAPPAYESPAAACPVDMVLVSGVRCAEPVQQCLEWIPRNGKSGISCREFRAPSRCEGQRTNMRYCIDRYELTPEGYDYPLTHVNWTEATLLCARMEKRLCYEDEWEFACEGPDAIPYPYGYVRDGRRCHHDIPEIELVTKADHFIDHRVAKDALPGCVSPFGVYNIIGNVDEWTTRRSDPTGQRAILRGGWWLQGRNRCRAATANHGEIYAGMQTGLRCCKAARSRAGVDPSR